MTPTRPYRGYVMKPQFFLQTLTSAVLLTGINAYNVNLTSTQLSKEKLIAPVGKILSQEASNAYEDYDLFIGMNLIQNHEQFSPNN